MVGKSSYLALPAWVVVAGVVFAVVLLYLVRAILAPFVVGASLAFVLSPLVGRVQEHWNLPRPLAIASIYIAIIGPIVILAVLLGREFLEETRLLIFDGPVILTTLIQDVFGPGPYNIFGTTVDARQIIFGAIGSIRQSFGTPAAAVRLLADVSDAILNTFLTLIVSIYLLGDEMRVGNLLLSLFPADRRDRVVEVGEDIHRTLARYLRRQVVLIALVAAATLIGLVAVFHLKYALPLAVFTGVVEIVPLLGPLIAASVAALVALTQGGVTLLVGVVVFYVILRQVEDQVVMPVVLGRAVQLHPIVVIFAVLAGGALFGVLGTLAAVPAAAAMKVIVDSVPLLFGDAPEKAPSAADAIDPESGLQRRDRVDVERPTGG